MKRIGFIGQQLRSALNEQRGYVDADELSAAIFQASNTVFGHKRGHSALYRPGQPVPPQGYQLTAVLDMALHPFLTVQRYATTPGPNELPLAADGTLLFPVIRDGNGQPTLENSFQYPTALLIDGARSARQVNDNAVQQSQANSLTAATGRDNRYCSVPGGFRLLFVPESAGLQYLAAPPRPVFAEAPAAPGSLDLVYDDANSVDVGWLDVTAINEIIAHATRILGGQVKDAQAVGLATQTAQMGA